MSNAIADGVHRVAREESGLVFHRISIGGESITQLAGRLTYAYHKKARDILEGMRASTMMVQFMDLSRLTFIDSSGLGLLLIMRKELEAVGKVLILRGATGQVRRMFDLAQLGLLITIESSAATSNNQLTGRHDGLPSTC